MVDSQNKREECSHIVVLGDFCLSNDNLSDELSGDFSNCWSGLRSVFSPKDKILANLEGPFTAREQGLPFKWANLKVPPKWHTALDELSMVILSNNHIADFGAGGVHDTLELLEAKQIKTVGYGETINAAVEPAVLDVDGKKLGVVALCCPTTNSENLATHLSPGVAPLGMATLKQAVDGARSMCDALLVYLHWGCEWVHDPAPDQLRLARHAIDCGADAVVGCHSHTIQTFEQYRGRWIFYGLGNYLFKAGYAQAVRENGRIEKVSIRDEPSNRESLAVSFKIVPDNGEGCLDLEHIQPMLFRDGRVRPIEKSDLTFDLDAANIRLEAYVEREELVLRDRGEPVFKSKLRNGVMAYWYSPESLVIIPEIKISLGMRLLGQMKEAISQILRKIYSA